MGIGVISQLPIKKGLMNNPLKKASKNQLFRLICLWTMRKLGDFTYFEIASWVLVIICVPAIQHRCP
jgi:hypothetical protein